MEKNTFRKWLLLRLAPRRMRRHFRRLGILDVFKSGTHTHHTLPAQAIQPLFDAAQNTTEALYATLQTSALGLSQAQTTEKQEKYGINEVGVEKPMPWFVHLWVCYKNPFSILLTVLAIITYYTEDIKATVVITTMVVLSTLMRFIQEARSNKAAEKLMAMVSNTATILRPYEPDSADHDLIIKNSMLTPQGSIRLDIPMKNLVPGDMVILSAGDMVPADIRLLNAKDLFIAQSAMTGESLPVEKFAKAITPTHKNPLELNNICFMGTTVVSGTATGVVVHTGKRTYFGLMAERITAAAPTTNNFQKGINQVSFLLLRFMLIMTPIVLVLNGFTKGNWIEACLFALSIAVGLTPEMLPMIVTSTLAKGAVVLSRKKVIVKHLDAIQTFGAMDILCTDKTGTLTQDKIFLSRHTDAFGNEYDAVLEYAFLNSYYQTGLKNLLDVAVLEHIELRKELNLSQNYKKVDEIPFDFVRRRMSVVVSEKEDHHELICKGALHEVLNVCTFVRNGNTVEPLTPELFTQIRAVAAELNEEGLRVVAVAAKDLPPTKNVYSIPDETELTLIGYIAFLDPPKESTAPALQALHALGITVKILTGDNERVTGKICKEVGLYAEDILLGDTIDTLSEEALAQAVQTTTAFARLTPFHKERIIKCLHNMGHTVGFLGDGINDAAALRAADIGISVDTAVDIAKEAADIILLEKSLMVLQEGVREGRKTFINMLKYIKMTASSNFGNIFSVLIASAFLPFLPMLPIHLLVQNLLYDFSQIAIPFDNVDEEYLHKPQKWDAAGIGRFMLFFGPISSLFDITTFAVLWFVFQANTDQSQIVFQSGWFMEGLLSQILIVHMIRTQKIPFIQSHASVVLLLSTLGIMVVGISLPYSMLAPYFKLTGLPLSYFGWLAAILLAYMVLTQCVKGFYAKKFGWY